MNNTSFDPKAMSANDLTAAVRHVLANYPEDVVSFMNSVSDSFSWVADVFSMIRKAAEVGDLSAIKRHATMGPYLAEDADSYYDCVREQMADAVQAAGCACTEQGVRHE